MSTGVAFFATPQIGQHTLRFFVHNNSMPIHSTFLRYFNEVCHAGSIRKAAGNLHVSYSAISRQILNIEKELGVTLLKRNTSGVKPTIAGALLQQHIVRTIQDSQYTLREILNYKQTASGKILILGQESIIDRFLPPVLAALYAKYPDITTEIKTANGDKLIDQLQAQNAGIAIVFDPDIVPDIQIITAQNLAVGAVVARDHAFAGKTKVSLRECIDYPLILPDKTWPLRNILDELIKALDITPNISHTSNSVEFLRKMLENKEYVGFQTVVGIESQLEKGKLMHIPLYGKALVTQSLSLCISGDAHASDAFTSALTLLSERITEYSDNHCA